VAEPETAGISPRIQNVIDTVFPLKIFWKKIKKRLTGYKKGCTLLTKLNNLIKYMKGGDIMEEPLLT
jgi:hypothetical protein